MGEGKKKRKIVIDISTHSRLVIRVYSRYPISLSPPPVDVEHIDDVWIRTACWLLRLFIKFAVIAIQLAHFLIHGNMKSPAEMLIQRYKPVWHRYTRIHQRIQVDNVVFVQLFSLSWHEQQCRAESFRQTVCLSVCMYKRPGISHNRVFLFLSLSLSVSLLTLICLNYHRRSSGASL